jgi:hypothetical protein
MRRQIWRTLADVEIPVWQVAPPNWMVKGKAQILR